MLKKQALKIAKIIAILAIIVGGGFVGIRGIYSALEWETHLKPASLSQAPFNGVSGVFKDEPNLSYYGLAVGKNEAVVYYNSLSWSKVAPPIGSGSTNFDFNDVWAQDYQNFWVVGRAKSGSQAGVLYHFSTETGTGSWDEVLGSGYENYNFQDVAGVTNGTTAALFVVGSNNSNKGVILYKTDIDDPTFSTFSLSEENIYFTSVSVIFDRDSGKYLAWAVTGGSDVRIYYFNGNSWTAELSGVWDNFNGVTAVDKNHVWAVGNNGKIYSGGPTAFTDISPAITSNISLQSVSGVYDSDKGIYKVWAVGDFDPNTKKSSIFYFNGSNWQSQNQGVSDNLKIFDVYAINSDHVWAVGEGRTIWTLSPGNLGGWAWTGADNCEESSCPSGVNKDSTLGWMSLNCADLGLCLKREFTYGVNIDEGAIDANGKAPLEGYAWFGAKIPINPQEGPVWPISWLSFNRFQYENGSLEGETGNPPDAPYQSGTGAVAKYEPASGKLSGWARFLELKKEYGSNAGWVKLRGNSINDPTSDDYDSNFPTGYSFSDCYGVKMKTIGQETNPWPENCDKATPPNCDFKVCKGTKGLDTNYSCNQCGKWEDLSPSPNGSCNNETGICTACFSCDKYGVSADGKSGRVSGYAWSDNSSVNQGVGWIDFSQSYYRGKLWLETLWSDIYSETRIGSGRVVIPPSGKYNATYMLQCGGPSPSTCTITNFTSAGPSMQIGTPLEFWTRAEESTMKEVTFPEAPEPLPAPQIYTSTIGKIDYQGLTTIVANGKNKYGQEVKEYIGNTNFENLTPFQSPPIPPTGILGGKVYHIKNGDLTIFKEGGMSYRIKNGTDSTSDGAGLIIVDGNVRVKNSLEYESGSINNLKRLASLGFFIKGDLIIESRVTNLVGAYYVGGKAEVQSSTNPVNDLQFVNYGPMIAKEFKFSRQWRGSVSENEPAEKIIYDGRVVANPPPGFDDLSKNLPVVREVMP